MASTNFYIFAFTANFAWTMHRTLIVDSGTFSEAIDIGHIFSTTVFHPAFAEILIAGFLTDFCLVFHWTTK